MIKFLTCVLTFLAYSSLHTLRMCYSFNKIYIKREFHITDFYLGVLDALVYLSLGAGTLMRYSLIRNPVHLTTIYLSTTICASISIAMISVLGLISDHDDITNHHHYFLFRMIITAALIIFGFMQLTSRPIVTTLLGGELKAEQHGCLVGAWASHASAGHISGLLLSNLLVYTFKLKWQISIFIGGIGCILIALTVYFVLQNPIEKLIRKQNKQPSIQKQIKIQQQLREHSSHEFYTFVKQMLHSTEYKFYIITYTLTKSMVYTFLLWYPIFLSSVKLKRYSGYITILFEVASIIGSLVFGKLYEIEIEHYKKKQTFEGVESISFVNKIAISKSFISTVCMTIIFGIFYFSSGSILIYCLFSFGIGLFLGGTANTLGSNDVMAFAKNDQRRMDYLTNFNIGLSSCFVGVIQLLVGFALYEENEVKGREGFTQREIRRSQHSYRVLFLILLSMGVIVTVLFGCRLFFKRQQEKEKTEYDLLEQQ